jgi:hypothetical protein
MRQRPPEPVQPLDNERVPCAEVGERLAQAWPLSNGTRGSVGVELLAAGRRQRVLLEGEGLIEG